MKDESAAELSIYNDFNVVKHRYEAWKDTPSNVYCRCSGLRIVIIIFFVLFYFSSNFILGAYIFKLEKRIKNKQSYHISRLSLNYTFPWKLSHTGMTSITKMWPLTWQVPVTVRPGPWTLAPCASSVACISALLEFLNQVSAPPAALSSACPPDKDQKSRDESFFLFFRKKVNVYQIWWIW